MDVIKKIDLYLKIAQEASENDAVPTAPEGQNVPPTALQIAFKTQIGEILNDSKDLLDRVDPAIQAGYIRSESKRFVEDLHGWAVHIASLVNKGQVDPGDIKEKLGFLLQNYNVLVNTYIDRNYSLMRNIGQSLDAALANVDKLPPVE